MFLYKKPRLPRTIVLLLSLMCSVATAGAQEGKISLRGGKMSAAEIMKYVESQTNYRFSYNRNIYDSARVIELNESYAHLNELLDDMVAGADVNYMVRGRYIAFVPANDNSRPQVRRQQTGIHTSDVYVPGNPDDTAPAPRQSAAVVEMPKPAREPEKEQYSDYRRVDVYGDVQKSLPRFGLRVNILYGAAALTPNISAEAALSMRSTIGISYSVNPWKYKADMYDNRKLLHGIVSLDYRYWFCERYNGHFLGARAIYSEYNVSGYDIPTLFDKEYRYKGKAYGGGVFYGYALPVARMWNLEFAAGLNVLRMDYDRYGCRTCDRNSQPFQKTYLAPSAGINLVFLIK